jgi:hypothetical protein
MSKNRRLFPLMLLLTSTPLVSDSAAAQNVSAASAAEAEAVVRKAFAELDSLRWAGVAALVHPETLARFHAMSLENARSAERHRGKPYPRDPDMPAAVAAWFEEQRRKAEEEQKQSGSMLSLQYAGVDSLPQLETLSAEEMFARHLQANDPRELLRRQMMANGMDVDAFADIDAPFQPQRTVIGAAVEDDSTVQVVYRLRYPAGPPMEPGGAALVTTRRTPAGWRLWSGSSDPALFQFEYAGGFAALIMTEEETLVQRLELSRRVVTWPLEGGGEGRAFIVGYTGGDAPPEGLAIELHRPDGTKLRVDVPFPAFLRLAELLFGWPE